MMSLDSLLVLLSNRGFNATKLTFKFKSEIERASERRELLESQGRCALVVSINNLGLKE